MSEQTETPLRIIGSDGTLHFSDLKKLSLSGRQYLHAVNNPTEPTSAMLIGTAVHEQILGRRLGAKPIVVYPGKVRRGSEWNLFQSANEGAEILSASESERAKAIADAVLADPVAQRRLEGGRYEVPLIWEDGGFRCSTSGIDIISGSSLCDLKTTSNVEPEAWKRHALRMNYHCQMAWYRRGARANGIDCSRGLYVLGVETKPPYEVVELELTEEMIDMAERTLTLWIERLRSYSLACPSPKRCSDWPGYAQTSVQWDVPSWDRDIGDDEDEDEEVSA